MAVTNACKPRGEVLKGDLTDAIFAADFGHLLSGTAADVYKKPKTFFGNTYPAQRLKTVAQRVFGRLADPNESGAMIRLSTGFGGGKTHTLMALWHLGNNIEKATFGSEILPAAGRPRKVKVVGIDAGKAGSDNFGDHDGVTTRSLWGEFFYGVGGKRALSKLGEADDPHASPSESQIDAVLPDDPLLILLDELVIYMAQLSDRGQGNILGFINRLVSVASRRPQTVVVVTDPAGQVAYAPQAAQLGESLTNAAAKLDDVLSRTMTDLDPIGDEAARVITRRLFEKIDVEVAQKVSAQYHDLYKRVADDSAALLPGRALTVEYAQKVVETYPFHPRLLETAQDRLGAMPDFQRSRGVLRLFARIIRNVWNQASELDLISAGELDWSDGDIQSELLSHLSRDRFSAAVRSDILGHAREVDGDKHPGIHERVASALLLESLPLQENCGFDPAECTLATIRLDEAGPEPAEALDRLVGVCWHTYPMSGGRGFQFRYEPNVLKQIEERLADIPIEDGRQRLLSEVQEHFGGPTFKVIAWPDSAREVPESASLQLVLCRDEDLAKRVCEYSDDHDPQSPMPRTFRNAVLAVTTTPSKLNAAVDRARRLIAAEQIKQEHRSRESAALVREQLKKIEPELLKRFRVDARRAFDRVVLPGGMTYSIEERFQISEDEILKRPRGQKCLNDFLEEKDLIYRAEEALEVNLFVSNLLSGATPQPDQPGMWTAKAVHERFLSAPNLRLVPNTAVVRETIRKAIEAGKIVLRLPDGRTFDKEGVVEGPDGQRQRRPGLPPVSFDLEDRTFIALTASEAAQKWTTPDEKTSPTPEDDDRPGGPTTPGIGDLPGLSAGPVTATTWNQVLDAAGERPLKTIELTAAKPAHAAGLITLAQPLSADRLTLTINVSGDAKDGGWLQFSAQDVKPTHPTKPLAIAQTIFNALREGSMFQATLRLEFGEAGRMVSLDILERLRDAAPDDLSVKADFALPQEAAV